MSKTLEELEGSDWGEPTYPSRLVVECHRLHRVPLQDFTAADLDLMIGQNIGLGFLVPIALRHLVADPFVDASFYPGDLLETVLTRSEEFWKDRPTLRQEAKQIATTARARLDEGSECLWQHIPPSTDHALRAFLADSPR